MNLRAQFDNMSPREQKLLMILGGVFAAILFLGVPIYIWTELWSTRDHNEEIRALLDRMNKANELLALRKKEREAVERRFAKPAPALASFVESAAQQNGVDVPESTDRPEINHKGYKERVTVVRLKKVGLRPLVQMLEKIVRSGHPVAITQLNIKSRISAPDEYDAQIAVSAYDKLVTKTEDKAGAGKAPKGKAPKGKTPDKEGGEEEKEPEEP